MLAAQFALYKVITSYSNHYEFRQFVYFSTLASLFGLTDFGLSISAQRLASKCEISLDPSRHLMGLAAVSVILAVIFAILGSLLYFRLDNYSITSFRLGFFLFLLISIFVLNIAFLLSSCLCRIGFSSSVHGYVGSLIMALGPMLALVLLFSGQILSVDSLRNPSINFAIGSGASFVLTIIYMSRSSPQVQYLLGSISRSSLLSGCRPSLQSFHDWFIGSLGMLTLQSDLIIVLILKSQNLSAYFLVVKVISVFAFLSSISLPRVFSIFAENSASDSSLIAFRRYNVKSWIFPLLSFPCAISYLYFMGFLSTEALVIAFILSIVLYLRIMTDFFSCALQAKGRVRELTTYLPFQFAATVAFGIFLGGLMNSVGVAFAQLAGFSLIAYPWLRRKFNSVLPANS